MLLTIASDAGLVLVHAEIDVSIISTAAS